jgi:hypothetical protein
MKVEKSHVQTDTRKWVQWSSNFKTDEQTDMVKVISVFLKLRFKLGSNSFYLLCKK